MPFWNHDLEAFNPLPLRNFKNFHKANLNSKTNETSAIKFLTHSTIKKSFLLLKTLKIRILTSLQMVHTNPKWLLESIGVKHVNILQNIPLITQNFYAMINLSGDNLNAIILF